MADRFHFHVTNRRHRRNMTEKEMAPDSQKISAWMQVSAGKTAKGRQEGGDDRIG